MSLRGLTFLFYPAGGGATSAARVTDVLLSEWSTAHFRCTAPKVFLCVFLKGIAPSEKVKVCDHSSGARTRTEPATMCKHSVTYMKGGATAGHIIIRAVDIECYTSVN